MRLDIQGLRALAVVLVVVFHLFPKHLSGGYIGVDVFFVISGFLITGHLLREFETHGRIRITEFWARRVRRLLPASLLVLLATILLTMTVMPVNSRFQNYGDIGYAAGYILNWRLASNSVDYLNSELPPTLVQHYWSLSIEEQFYLVWPVLMLFAIGIAAIFKQPSRRSILAALVIVLLASLTFSIWETARSQPLAYFVTTTRAWEFALGGIVAMIPATKLRAPARGALSALALVGIIASASLFGETTAFPGSIALIPVAATALLIWIGDNTIDRSGAERWKLTPQRLSHNRVIQFLGKTSYSIYLWHWPLLLAVTAAFPVVGWGWRRASVVVPATLIMAWLTQKFVEDPIRKAPGILRRRSAAFGFMFVAVAAIIGLTVSQLVAIQRDVAERQARIESLLGGSQSNNAADTKLCIGAYAILNNCENPHAYEEALVDPVVAQEDEPSRWIHQEPAKSHCTIKRVGSWNERACSFPGDGKQIMLLGDSHADQLSIPLQQVAAEQGWALRMEVRAACQLFKVSVDPENQDAVRCEEWSREKIDSIVADPAIDVVVINVREDRVRGATNPKPSLTRLRDAGKQVIVVRDTPTVGITGSDGIGMKGPDCLIEQGVVDDPCTWADSPQLDWLASAATELNMTVIDTHKMVCPDGICHMISGDLVVYHDGNHLTGMYAKTLAGWLKRELQPLID